MDSTQVVFDYRVIRAIAVPSGGSEVEDQGRWASWKGVGLIPWTARVQALAWVGTALAFDPTPNSHDGYDFNALNGKHSAKAQSAMSPA